MSALSSFHPAVLLALFASEIVLCLVVRNPAFAAAGFAAAALSYVSVRGAAGWRVVGAAAVLALVVAVANALFNPMGETVLFEYLAGRRFTAESLAFGAATGGAFSTALLWFGCLNRVMSTDQFTFLSGSFAPALTTTLAMAVRFIPRYRVKASEIAEARRCIGMGPSGRGPARAARAAVCVLSALATWAFEGAVVTADSMRSRGYGCARRTSYALRPWTRRDALALALVLALDAGVVLCLVAGAEATAYLPSIELPFPGGAFWAGLASYAGVSALPAIVNAFEGLKWRLSLSRI